MQNKHGFTLIELVITIAIAGIIASALISVTAGTLNTVDLASKRGGINRMATFAIRLFSRDVAHLGDPGTPLLTAEAKRIKFKSTLGRPVEYYFSNGVFYLDVAGANDPAPVCNNVNMTESYFRYYDASDQEMTPSLSALQRQNVKSIELVLVVLNDDVSISLSRKVMPLNYPWKGN